MDIPALVRAGVATAKGLVGSAMVTVQVEHWDGVTLDAFGNPDLDAPVPYRAVWTKKQGAVRSTTQVLVQYQSTLGFLDPISLRVEDRITLPDGTTGPILNFGGAVDPGTDLPYAAKVYLG